MSSPFRLETLGREHDRSAFACGEAALDRYFQTQATQDVPHSSPTASSP